MFVRILKGILLGAVQGLTEFLPVSSSGHLLLLERLGVTPPNMLLNLTLHLATLAAVCIVMRRDVWHWIRHPLDAKARWLYLSCIPTAALAVVLSLFAKEWLSGRYLAVGFLLTSCLLVWAGHIQKTAKPLTPFNALAVGVVHGLATLPGLSRSGATVSAMRLAGINENQAISLSFLLAIPVTVGGIAWELLSHGSTELDIPLTVSAALSAFVFGLLSLKAMLRELDAPASR